MPKYLKILIIIFSLLSLVGGTDFLCKQDPLVSVDELTVLPTNRRKGVFLLDIKKMFGIKICKICETKFKSYNNVQKYCNICRNKKYFCLKCGNKITKHSKSGLCKCCWQKGINYNNKYGKAKAKKIKRKLSILYKGKSYEEAYGKEKAINMKRARKRTLEDRVGKKRADKIKKILSKRWLRKNNPNWVEGLITLYPLKFNNKLKNKIRKRDNYQCQICRKTKKENKRKLDIHHINYNKKNSKETNLITLCQQCHSKTNRNRDYWLKYFEEMQQKLKKKV